MLNLNMDDFKTEEEIAAQEAEEAFKQLAEKYGMTVEEVKEILRSREFNTIVKNKKSIIKKGAYQ